MYSDRSLLLKVKDLPENACSDRIHYHHYDIGDSGGEWRASSFCDAVENKEADDWGKKVGS